MNDISECYRVLDLEDGASLEEVKRSYRELVKVWHPDRFRGDLRLQAKAEEKLKRINLAYERLCAAERTKATTQAAEAAPRRDSAPKASFPHPPKPRPNPPQSYDTHTTPQIATDGRGKINSLIRHPWVIAGLVVVVIVCGTLWSWKRETMSSEAARLLKAANRGDANAQFSLGKMYAAGNGVAINAAKGVEWMLKAAKQNHIDSQLYLGMTYSNGLGVPEDDSKGVEWYRKAAESGNATAQYLLGLQYSVGEGVPEDQAKSIEWIRKAAEQGDADAQFHLGEKYGNGEGIPEDMEKALFWIQKAAIQGHVAAQIRLGEMYGFGFGVAKDAAKAAEWFTKAANQGDSSAQIKIGEIYASGRGVQKSDNMALEWFRKAAAQDNGEAQVRIGDMYAAGIGLQKDTAKANEWYGKPAAQKFTAHERIYESNAAERIRRDTEQSQKRAAEGDAESQYELGRLYAGGVGVPKDQSKAIEWHRKAAEQGLTDAQYHLGLKYSVGRGVPVDKAESRRWFLKAAEGGHIEAQEELGEIYSDGIDIPEDYQKSLLWFRKAAAQGSESAQVYLGLAYEHGKGVPIDNEKAAEWYRKAAAQGHGFGDKNLQDLQTKNLLYPKGNTFNQPLSSRSSLAVGNTSNLDASTLRHLATDDRLTSGSLLVDNLSQSAGKGKLTLDNGLAEDACVKLIQNGKMLASFYVRSGGKFTYSTIPDGTYSVLYSTGYGWDTNVRNFARGRQAARFDAPLEYRTRQQSDSTGTTTLTNVKTLTLHKVASGNAKTSSVGLDEFDRF